MRTRAARPAPVSTAWPWPATDVVQQRISANAQRLLPLVVRQARTSTAPTVELARGWHRALLRGVPLAAPEVAGGLRGSAAPERLRTCRIAFGAGPAGRPVRVHAHAADGLCHVAPEQVADALVAYETRLVRDDAALGDQPPRDAVLDLCAWVAVEWAHIHPFVDLNGATGRLWVTHLAARHGLELVLAPKPRPDRLFELPSGEELTYTRGVRCGTEHGDLTHLRRWLELEAGFQQRDPHGPRFLDQRPAPALSH